MTTSRSVNCQDIGIALTKVKIDPIDLIYLNEELKHEDQGLSAELDSKGLR